MPCHLLEDFLGHAEAFEVTRINDEEDAVDIGVEEAPAITVSALHITYDDQTLVETYLT